MFNRKISSALLFAVTILAVNSLPARPAQKHPAWSR